MQRLDASSIGTPGKEEIARAAQAHVVHFGHDCCGLRIAPRPVAHRKLDHHAAPASTGAVNVDHVIDLGQLLAGLGACLLDDVADPAFLPMVQDRKQQVAAVLKVPVETALGHLEALGEHLDAQAGNAFLGQHLDGGGHPAFAIELDTGLLGVVFHTA